MRFQNAIYLLILYYDCVVKSYCTTDKDWFVEEQKIEKKFGYDNDKYKIEYLKIFENLWKSYQNVDFCYVERDVRFIDTQDIAYVSETQYSAPVKQIRSRILILQHKSVCTCIL